MRTKLQPQFLTQSLALLEAREELIEKANDDGVDADAFGFGPVFELGTGFGSDVEKLRIGDSNICALQESEYWDSEVSGKPTSSSERLPS